MPKRKLDSDGGSIPSFSSKPDSDDEESISESNIGVLSNEEIEGQEDATVDNDSGIQITPFNMKDEMEEGYFDKQGMFLFDKNKGRIKDNWVDNVDWMKITTEKHRFKETKVNDVAEDMNSDDCIAAYTEMIQFLRPGETVLKCIRRLGGGKSTQSASERWGKKKRGGGSTAGSSEDADENRKLMLRLTELADLFIQDGNMDIYETTHERIAFLLKSLQEPKSSVTADYDVSLDMFAEETDQTTDNRTASDVVNEEKSDKVTWMYKWEDTDTAEEHGPVSTRQMFDWSNGDYFEKGAFCRKSGAEGQFYNVKRIDFELYL